MCTPSLSYNAASHTGVAHSSQYSMRANVAPRHPRAATSPNMHTTLATILAALNEPLRSHGGLYEQTVPFIVNRVLELDTAPDLRNFDAFFYATKAAAL